MRLQFSLSHHGLLSYNSSSFLCSALCSKNTRTSKGLAKYTQSFYYALGINPGYFGFCGLRLKGDMALQTYLVKGQGWNIKKCYKSVIFWPILMKICMQLPFRPPFAHAHFQLGRKGQRPKGRKVKRQNFKKLSRSNYDHILSPPHWFHFIFSPKNGHCRRFGGFSPLCIVFLSNVERKIGQNCKTYSVPLLMSVE